MARIVTKKKKERDSDKGKGYFQQRPNFTKGTRIFFCNQPRSQDLHPGLGVGREKPSQVKVLGTRLFRNDKVAKAKGSISSKSLEFGRKYRKSNKGGFACKGHVLVNKNRKYHKNNKFRK